jgi:hypothetical protein
MNQISVHEPTGPLYFHENRMSEHQRVVHLLAVTERGTGQILDISSDGFSFGCLYPHKFPDAWTLDILDSQGSHIKKLKVRKIWEISKYHPHTSTKFELVIGVEFVDLTAIQTDGLEFVLDNLDPVDELSLCLA